MIDKKILRKQVDIKRHINERIADWKNSKPQMDRLWYANILTYRGEQWVTFDYSQLRFRRSNQRRTIPRPVTNKYASIANSLISAILRFDPRNVFAPQTDTQEDVNTAFAGNKIDNAIMHEIKWQCRKAELAPWYVLTGNAFTIAGIDMSAGPKVRYIKSFCPACGETYDVKEEDGQYDCERCAEEDGVKSPLQPEMDETGQPKATVKRAGALALDLASPFEMFLDPRISDLDDHQSIARIHNKSVEWVKERWPEAADRVKPEVRPELNTRLLGTLATLTHPAAVSMEHDTTDVVEFWEKPCEKFEQGFYCVLNGDEILELRPFVWISKREEPYFPITHWRYDTVPGTIWGKTPMTDLVEKQRTRNRIEAIGEMILMRMSNPVWIAPNPGTKTVPSGHVGQIIYYDPHLSGGQPPQRVDSAMLPPSFVQWMTLIDKDMQDIPGIAEVLRGERPLSVKSGYAIQKLEEIAKARNTAMYNNFANAQAHMQTALFELFRKVMPTSRYSRILGDNLGWTVQKIKEADISGGIDVYVEPGSSLPKSHLEELATLEMLLGMQLLDINDPQVRLKIYRKYGLSNILPSVDMDDQYIGREHDRFKKGGKIAVSPFDNNSMHLARHLEFWKSEAFEAIQDEQQRNMFLEHIQQHQEAVQKEQQQQLEMQMQAAQAAKGGVNAGG